VLDGFAEPVRRVVVLAQVEARSLRHNYIGTEHLLLGLLAQDEGPAVEVLRSFGVERERTRAQVIEILGMGPPEGLDPAALETIGIDLDEVRRRVEEAFGPGALERTRAARTRRRVRSGARRRPWSRRPHFRDCTMPVLPGGMCFTPRVKKVLELSLREARHLGHDSPGPGHLLLGLLREGEGVAALILSRSGIDFARARALVVEALDNI
jgi:ATP-dependent Clp protease ATP-binding subunit ClpA